MPPIANLDIRFLAAIVFVFGLMIGSFLNVVIYRLPAEQSIVWPGSHCPKCDRPLQAWENVPVFSWIFLRARCSTCKSPISWRYPAIELLTACLFTAVFVAFGPTLQTCFLLVLTGLMIAIFWIDYDTRFIYDQTTFPGIALGFVYSGLVTHQLLVAIAAALYAVAAVSLVYGLSWLVWREEGIGGGDLTLVAMIGAWLGLKGMIIALGLGVIFGAVIGMAVVFKGYVDDRYWAPVALSAGVGIGFFAWCEVLFGTELTQLSTQGPGRFLAHAFAAALAALLGASAGYFYARATRDKGTERPSIPFGPSLVLGGLVSLFWGDALVGWYVAHLGPM